MIRGPKFVAGPHGSCLDARFAMYMSAWPNLPLRLDPKYSAFPSRESRREKSPAVESSTGAPRFTGSDHGVSLFGRVETNRSRYPFRSDVKRAIRGFARARIRNVSLM